MDDLISRQALMKEFIDFVRKSNNSDFAQMPTWNDAVSLVGSMPSVKPEQRWIPVKTRPMDDEEIREWEERTGFKLDEENAVFFDCKMPDDGQEVLVCSSWGHIFKDMCVIDEYGIGLDENGDWEGIVAWMPLPDPWKGEEDESTLP